MDTAEQIRTFIQEEIAFGDDVVTITDETPLYEGIVDSLALINLVAFLEKEFGILIEDADLSSENFQTVTAITRLVQRRSDVG